MDEPDVLMYTTSWCGYCTRARRLFEERGVRFRDIDIEEVDGARQEMIERSGRTSVPQIFIDDRHIGGYDDAKALDEAGQLQPMLAGTVGD